MSPFCFPTDLYAALTTLQYAYGPDEVQHRYVGRAELQKYNLW